MEYVTEKPKPVVEGLTHIKQDLTTLHDDIKTIKDDIRYIKIAMQSEVLRLSTESKKKNDLSAKSWGWWS